MTPAASLCDGHARACPTQPLGTDLPSRSSSQDQAGLIRRAATSPKRGEPPMASTRAPPRDRVVIGDEQKASVDGFRCLTLNACRGIQEHKLKREKTAARKSKSGTGRGVLMGQSLDDYCRRRRGRRDQHRRGHAGRHGDAKAASSRLLCPAGGGRQVASHLALPCLLRLTRAPLRGCAGRARQRGPAGEGSAQKGWEEFRWQQGTPVWPRRKTRESLLPWPRERFPAALRA